MDYLKSSIFIYCNIFLFCGVQQRNVYETLIEKEFCNNFLCLNFAGNVIWRGGDEFETFRCIYVRIISIKSVDKWNANLSLPLGVFYRRLFSLPHVTLYISDCLKKLDLELLNVGICRVIENLFLFD